jgi:hypothetical protein
MKRFSSGISLASVIHPNSGSIETWGILTGAVSYQEDANGKKVYAWHKATVTPRNCPDEQTLASIVEMAQIARFVDNFNRHGNAVSQLRDYVYLLAIAMKYQQAPVALQDAA